MEESKDLQSLYKIFRTFIYLSLVVEFFEYAINPEVLDFWGGILVDIHDRLKLMDVYQDGHMLRSKIMTFLMICVTCVGTRNKKHLEFNAKRMVIYPITFGVILMFFSVWVFNRHWNPTFFTLHSSTWIYFVMSVVGTVLVHVALDNISKYLKDGLLKDRFNFGNETYIDIQIVTLYLYLFLVNFWLNLGVWQRNLDGKRKGATAGLQCRKLPLEEV
ncbi:MAG: YWFCY domain-containing protein [Prevotella sp.]|nr:YWFCY domain-containing protein [Prevotella sp.]